MLEATEDRLRREDAAHARLMAEVRGDALVRPPQARAEHFATVFSNRPGDAFRAACRCGWQGRRYALSGERPFANWRVISVRLRAAAEAEAHNRGGEVAA